MKHRGQQLSPASDWMGSWGRRPKTLVSNAEDGCTLVRDIFKLWEEVEMSSLPSLFMSVVPPAKFKKQTVLRFKGS